MEFINHTPFPSLAFQARDQYEQLFHVVVIRATLDIGEEETLRFSEAQRPLAVTDEYFGEMAKSSVRQESDLAPYKPKCDVILNATAYAPGGRPVPSFVAGIRITDTHSGSPLLEKRVLVTGPRFWVKRFTGWRLSPPESPVTTQPVRYEYAFGGQCRIDGDDPCAKRIGDKHLLPPELRAHHPDGADKAPAAHTVCETNPVGIGFAERWYLKATGLKRIPAPRIDCGEDPVLEFEKTYMPQGFGAMGKGWRPRRELCGTVDEAFISSAKSLPEDFDFGFWNCARPEMQIPYLKGDETIELTNLHRRGNLEFRLPGHVPYALVLHGEGSVSKVTVQLDTLLIEPDQDRVTCVYRLALPATAEVIALEARLIFNENEAASVREASHG